MYLHVVGVVFSRCVSCYPVSHAVQGGAGTSRIVGDQEFCSDVVANVTS